MSRILRAAALLSVLLTPAIARPAPSSPHRAVALSRALPAATATCTVHRRGTLPPLEGVIRSAEEGGLVLVSADGKDAPMTLSWDRVRSIEPKPDLPRIDEYLALGADLWRSRARLQRGDAALAEPALERLFERLRGQTHETALVAAEGLLRCRIARGAHAGAVIPAMECARMRRAGASTTAYAGLEPIIDEATMLAPRLAPFWLEPRGAARVASALGSYDAQGDEVVAQYAAHYRQAALWLSGDDTALHLPPLPAAEILHSCVMALAPDPTVRRDAAARLERQLEGSGDDWSRAWMCAVIGSSLIRDEGNGRKRQGALMLLRLPVDHGRDHPYLAGAALALAAQALGELGDEQGRAWLDEELRRRFPAHPVLLNSRSDQLQPFHKADS